MDTYELTPADDFQFCLSGWQNGRLSLTVMKNDETESLILSAMEWVDMSNSESPDSLIIAAMHITFENRECTNMRQVYVNWDGQGLLTFVPGENPHLPDDDFTGGAYDITPETFNRIAADVKILLNETELSV